MKTYGINCLDMAYGVCVAMSVVSWLTQCYLNAATWTIAVAVLFCAIVQRGKEKGGGND